jgi:hypothetical protein
VGAAPCTDKGVPAAHKAGPARGVPYLRTSAVRAEGAARELFSILPEHIYIEKPSQGVGFFYVYCERFYRAGRGFRAEIRGIAGFILRRFTVFKRYVFRLQRKQDAPLPLSEAAQRKRKGLVGSGDIEAEGDKRSRMFGQKPPLPERARFPFLKHVLKRNRPAPRQFVHD